LGGAISLGGTLALGLGPGESPLDRPAAAQDEGPLVIALLDTHAEQMKSMIDEYAASAEFGLEVTALEYGELYSQLSLALTQQSPDFDVVSLDDAWIPQFATFLTTIDAVSLSPDEIVPVVADLARFPLEAAPCGVPWLGDAQFFVTRPDWLDEGGFASPETWEATTNVAETLASTLSPEEELSSFAMSTLSLHDLVDSFLPILRGCGVDLIDAETSVPQLDTFEALTAIAYFQQLATISPVESSATGASTNIEQFERGYVAMMSNFWSSSVLATPFVEEPRFAGPMECSAQPSEGNHPRRSMTGSWIAGIPVGSLRAKQARDFVEWLISPEIQRAMVDIALPPVLAPIYADDGAIDAQPHLPQLLDLLATSTPRPRSPYYPQLELLLGTELQRMLDGEQSPEDTIRNANIAMREFLSREGVLVA
jgi:multiple sugar transport system substrate-binding protein